MPQEEMQQEFAIKDALRRKALRDTHGVEVVSQISLVNLERAEHARPFIYSFAQLEEAWRLSHDGGEIAFSFDAKDAEDRPTVVVWEMAMGLGTPFPNPTGVFELRLEGRPIARLSPTKSSKVWRCEGFQLAFHVKKLKVAKFGHALFLDPLIREEGMAAFGVAALYIPAGVLESHQPKLSLHPVGHKPSKNWLRVGRVPGGLAFLAAEDAVALAVTGKPRPHINGYGVYFGDIHSHTGESAFLGWGCGERSREENLIYARDSAGLDFYAITEHDWQMNEEDWCHLQALNERFNAEDAFVTLHAYEWTSCNYGHRNVYFLDQGGPFVSSNVDKVGYGTWNARNPHPDELWNALSGTRVEAMTAPHHTSAAQFLVSPEAYFNSRYDRFIEIYSCWGLSEQSEQPMRDDLCLVTDRYAHHSVNDFLRQGFRLGVVASSDCHDGHPGHSQGTSRRPHQYHYMGSGRVAVLAERHSREDIYFALKARRSYATTGEPIVLDFRYGEAYMGEEVKRNGAPFYLEVRGTSSLDKVEIVKDGEVVFSESPQSDSVAVQWCEPNGSSAASYYYLRVLQADGERAWSSPIWLDS